MLYYKILLLYIIISKYYYCSILRIKIEHQIAIYTFVKHTPSESVDIRRSV